MFIQTCFVTDPLQHPTSFHPVNESSMTGVAKYFEIQKV